VSDLWYNTDVLKNNLTLRGCTRQGLGQHFVGALTMTNIPQLKTCPKCGESRPLSDFHKNPARYDGRTSYCRYCRVTPKALERERLLASGLYRCTLCDEIKPLAEFSKSARATSGHMSKCKTCDSEQRRQRRLRNLEEERRKDRARNHLRRDEKREYMREWSAKNKKYLQRYRQAYYKANRTRILDLNRRWRAKHQPRVNFLKRAYKQRKRNAPGSFASEQFQALIQHYGRNCLCCGEQQELTADHVIPLNQGGADGIGNIQPLCASCNSAKGGYRDTDYRPDGGAFARLLEGQGAK